MIIFPALVREIDVVPTLSTTAYSAGDLLGVEKKYKLLNAVDVPGGQARLNHVIVRDSAKQDKDIKVLIFNQDPGTISSTDNTALALSAAQLDMLTGIIDLPAANYTDLSATSAADTQTPGNGLDLHSGTGKSDLWVVFLNEGTPTYAVGSLKFKFFFEIQQ